MKTKIVQLSLCLFFLTACQSIMHGTVQSMNEVTLGMSKSEVIDKLGEPSSDTSTDEGEVLSYKLKDGVVGSRTKNYSITLTANKVTAYGFKSDDVITGANATK